MPKPLCRRRRGIDWLANRPGTPSRRYRHLERLAQMAALVMEFPLLDETDRRRCSGQEPRSHPRRRGDDRHGRAGWRDHRRRSDRGSARAHRTAQPALNRSTAITVARTLATARGTAACAEHVRDASDRCRGRPGAVARSRSDADRRGDHRRAVVGNRRVADRLGIGATRRDRGHEDGLSRLALLKILGGRRI
jgi:hypothetical protein